MQIKLHGMQKGKRARNLLAFAAEYSRILGLDDYAHTLTIIMREGFHNLGQFYYEEEESFLVLKTGRVKDMLQTLAHEMIHAQQFITGALKHTHRGMKYRGKFYRTGELKWVQYPWEIEAMQLEVLLRYTAGENLNVEYL